MGVMARAPSLCVDIERSLHLLRARYHALGPICVRLSEHLATCALGYATTTPEPQMCGETSVIHAFLLRFMHSRYALILSYAGGIGTYPLGIICTFYAIDTVDCVRIHLLPGTSDTIV